MKELRLRRIFGDDGRTVIVACDHAGFMGPVQGLEEPGKLLDSLAGTGINAVLTTRGVAEHFGGKFGGLGLILRADGGASMASPVMGSLQPLFTVEDALKLGADAVICMGMIGFPEEPSSLANLAGFTAQALPWGFPVIAEMLVKPKEGKTVTTRDIGFAMRIGAELGADVIKASFLRPIDSYHSALKSCYCPVVVLGGKK